MPHYFTYHCGDSKEVLYDGPCTLEEFLDPAPLRTPSALFTSSAAPAAASEHSRKRVHSSIAADTLQVPSNPVVPSSAALPIPPLSAESQRLNSPLRIVQLKVRILFGRRDVWRRLQVPANFSLLDLARVIQITMNLDGIYPFVYKISERSFADSVTVGTADQAAQLGTLEDCEHFTVEEAAEYGRKFMFNYHSEPETLKFQCDIERVLEPKPTTFYPRVVSGKEIGPIEGTTAEMDKSDIDSIIKDKNHPYHKGLWSRFPSGFYSYYDKSPSNRMLSQLHWAVVSGGKKLRTNSEKPQEWPNGLWMVRAAID